MIVASSQAQPLNVIGVAVTVLASSAASGGMAFTLQEGPEGCGPPPHCHPWDEAFFVLEGSVEFVVDGTPTEVAAGTLVHVPGGTVHAFRYGAGGAKVFEVTSPGSRAAEMFADFDAEMPDGEINLAKVVDIFDRHGIRLMA